MTFKNRRLTVSKKMGLTMAMFMVLFVAFGIYVFTEKRIDSANDLRQTSYQLADQLHESSDDLTRMARAYVATGNPIYKQYYQDILDIRDGKKRRPAGYFLPTGIWYWPILNHHALTTGRLSHCWR